MQIIAISKPAPVATDYFRRALSFYAAHGQQDSAIALMTAGLLELSAQMARIEAEVVARQ